MSPGERWYPSNGAMGEAFINANCVYCARDCAMNGSKEFEACAESELCEILARSFREEVEEWRELPHGELICTAFLSDGMEPRCNSAELEAAGQERLFA